MRCLPGNLSCMLLISRTTTQSIKRLSQLTSDVEGDAVGVTCGGDAGVGAGVTFVGGVDGQTKFQLWISHGVGGPASPVLPAVVVVVVMVMVVVVRLRWWWRWGVMVMVIVVVVSMIMVIRDDDG